MSGSVFRARVEQTFRDLARLNHRSAQVPHTHQVVGGTGEGEYPVHLENPAMPHFPQQRDRLQPAETFFDALPLSLADGIARVARGARIDGAAASPPMVLCHVGCDSQMAAFGHEIRRIVPFVPAGCHRLRTQIRSSITSAAWRSAVPLASNTSHSWRPRSSLAIVNHIWHGYVRT